MVYMPSGHGVDDSTLPDRQHEPVRESSEQSCLGWTLCALHLPEVVCLGGYLNCMSCCSAAFVMCPRHCMQRTPNVASQEGLQT